MDKLNELIKRADSKLEARKGGYFIVGFYDGTEIKLSPLEADTYFRRSNDNVRYVVDETGQDHYFSCIYFCYARPGVWEMEVPEWYLKEIKKLWPERYENTKARGGFATIENIYHL